jgi:GDP-L-fucose synthase
MSGDRLKALGWTPRIGLEEGIRAVYAWYLEREAEDAALEDGATGPAPWN